MIHHDEATAEQTRAFEERRELLRLCHARIVANHEAGRGVDPIALQQARQFLARTKPLGRPLSDGANPARTPAHLPQENHR